MHFIADLNAPIVGSICVFGMPLNMTTPFPTKYSTFSIRVPRMLCGKLEMHDKPGGQTKGTLRRHQELPVSLLWTLISPSFGRKGKSYTY